MSNLQLLEIDIAQSLMKKKVTFAQIYKTSMTIYTVVDKKETNKLQENVTQLMKTRKNNFWALMNQEYFEKIVK